jgi:hypothetical protein
MKVRPTTPEDATLIQQWIDSDPDHKGKSTAEFFSSTRPEATNFTVLDKLGTPIFFVTLEKTVRGHIQFNPKANEMRNARGLMYLGAFLKQGLKRVNVVEFITESRYPALIGFLEKALGLVKLNCDYSSVIKSE